MDDSTQALVVDGDARTVLHLVRALSEQGIVVGAALNGADGLEEATRNDYDLVLAGVNLPDMAGSGFAEQVRNRLPEAYCVLIGPVPAEADDGKHLIVERPADADAAVGAVDAMFDALAEAEARERRARSGRPRLSELSGWRKVSRIATNIALFLISPFISLSYMIALPIVGVYSFLKTTLAGWQHKGGPRTP
ncbi:MAG: response regulator [Xanthomonadales bacterium]